MVRSAKTHVSQYLPIYVFAGLYFATTVLGNLAYLTSVGRQWPAISITDFSWHSFDVKFGVEYWALLLLPMILVPVIALIVARVAGPAAEYASPWVKEIKPASYTLISTVLFAYVFYSLYDANALSRMITAEGAINAVRARFDVLASIGYWPQMVMQSLLAFLAIYAVVRSEKSDGIFWKIAALVCTILLSIALILLNMKWPVIIFIILVAMSIFVASRKHAIIKVAAVLFLALFVYLSISIILLRMVPSPDAMPIPARTGVEAAQEEELLEHFSSKTVERKGDKKKIRNVVNSLFYIGDIFLKSIEYAPRLIVVAVNRMAMATPYYYDRFTKRGQICGTILDRILRKTNFCQPSRYIYAEMFRDDGFEAGTAPAAINIYGYALGGWAGAVAETIIAGIILGLFLALYRPAKARPIIMTAFVMGTYAAYFMTQLPIEAAVIYSHGMLWWAVMVIILSVMSATRFNLLRGGSSKP